MKHPALARVFAVVLVIMSLLMAANGVVGLQKTESEHGDRLAYVEKYQGRIENYVSLSQEVDNAISYDEAYEALQELQEQHDRDASQHRTDTALYTAEKGGNLMGADLIWEAMPAVKGAKAELEAGKRELDKAEKQLQATRAAYDAQKDNINSVISRARTGAAACNAESKRLGDAADNLNAVLQQQPTAPAEPQEPTEPAEVAEPTEPAEVPAAEKPAELPEDADEAAQAAYQEALDAYNSYQAYLAALAQYESDKAAYEQYRDVDYPAYLEQKAQYEQELSEYPEKLAAYQTEMATWSANVEAAVNGLNLMNTAMVLSTQGTALAQLAGEAQGIASALGVDTGSMGGSMDGGMDMSGLMGLLTPGAEPSVEQLQSVIPMLQGALGTLSAGFGGIESGLSQIGSGVEAAEAQFNTAKAQVAMAERELKKAETELNSQLANIWYNLEELEKDADRLAEEKETLDAEAELLSKKLMETDELRDLKNRHATARQLLINVPEIKAAYLETEDLASSASAYLETYSAQTQRLYDGKRLLNLLAIVGGVMGLVGLPAAFEKTKRRFWLIAPVLLCLLCAAAADGINMRLGLGQMYTALVTAVFAFLQLLIVSPKQKSFPVEEKSV